MQKGFTLIEMLVVMAIFMTVMLVVSDLFLTITTSQEKTLSGQKAMNDLQFNLDDLLRKIRASHLDYEAYNQPIANPVSSLNLIDKDGNKFSLKKDTVNCKAPAVSCVKMITANMETVMSTNQLDVNRLDFYIQPGVNPFKYDEALKRFGSEQMPLVTIVIGGESLESALKNRRKVDLQTSVSLRNYDR